MSGEFHCKIRATTVVVLLLLLSGPVFAQMDGGGMSTRIPNDSLLLNTETTIDIDSVSSGVIPLAFKSKNNTTPKQHKEITPKRIALLSLAAPGLGQIYNKRYWKLPIVYGLIGTGAFFTGRNAKELRTFKTALDLRFDSTRTDKFEGIYSTTELYAFRNFYQRNVEISAILMGFAWGLQVIDAVVDAHLKQFDISDDLSFRIKPSLLMVNNQIAPGVSFQLGFR